MRQPWEWELSDIELLIENGVQESLTLDYKACDALGKQNGKKGEVSKDVSAFANSAGGTIIYGVKEKDGYLPDCLDEGYDPSEISREWLEQIINSRIHRRIDGVRINPIELRDSPGRFIYVVHIPQSRLAPHMASDHRYYKRFNFESAPIEEYEVRDVANRSSGPELEVYFFLTGLPNAIVLQATIQNLSQTPAEYCMVNVYIDVRLSLAVESSLNKSGIASVLVGRHLREMKLYTMNWAIPARMPIWYGLAIPLFDRPITLEKPVASDRYFLAIEVHAPRMAARWQGYYLDVSNGNPRMLETGDIQPIPQSY